MEAAKRRWKEQSVDGDNSSNECFIFTLRTDKYYCLALSILYFRFQRLPAGHMVQRSNPEDMESRSSTPEGDAHELNPFSTSGGFMFETEGFMRSVAVLCQRHHGRVDGGLDSHHRDRENSEVPRLRTSTESRVHSGQLTRWKRRFALTVIWCIMAHIFNYFGSIHKCFQKYPEDRNVIMSTVCMPVLPFYD